MTANPPRWKRTRARIHKIREEKNGTTYEAWRLTWYVEGKRQRKRYPTRSSAEAQAALLNAAEASTESFRLLVTPEQAASVARAEQLLKPIGVSLEVAVADYAAAREKVGSVSMDQLADHWKHARLVGKSKPIPDAVREFLLDKAQDGAGERHVDSLTHYLKAFAKKLTGPCDALNSNSIDSYLRDQQAEREWSGLTRNHHRAAISNFTEWAKQRGYLPRQWAEMEFVPQARHERSAVEIFTPEDAEKLLAASEKEQTVLLAVGMFAGVRPSEICRMTWADIDWERQELHVGRQKVRTAGHRIVPLLPRLSAILSGKKRKPSKPLFPFGHSWAAHEVVKIAKAAGVKWIPDGPRHSFVSYRLAIVGDIARVSEETGTSAATLRKHYRRPVSQRRAEQWFESGPK